MRNARNTNDSAHCNMYERAPDSATYGTYYALRRPVSSGTSSEALPSLAMAPCSCNSVRLHSPVNAPYKEENNHLSYQSAAAEDKISSNTLAKMKYGRPELPFNCSTARA